MRRLRVIRPIGYRGQRAKQQITDQDHCGIEPWKNDFVDDVAVRDDPAGPPSAIDIIDRHDVADVVVAHEMSSLEHGRIAFSRNDVRIAELRTHMSAPSRGDGIRGQMA